MFAAWTCQSPQISKGPTRRTQEETECKVILQVRIVQPHRPRLRLLRYNGRNTVALQLQRRVLKGCTFT